MTPPRDTSTGRVLEELVELVLRSAGYYYIKQAVVGPKSSTLRADLASLLTQVNRHFI